MAIAEKHSLFVVEDNAQAIGGDFIFSDGRKAKTGTIGHIGCTSFFPSKNLGCYGDGGAVNTNDAELASKIKMIANHGQSKKYHHDMVGCNSRLDTIQAEVLRIKLPLLDKFISKRRKVADTYDTFFNSHPEFKAPIRAANQRHVFHQYTVQVSGIDRDALKDYLAEREVPSMIYYPIPAHKQKMFEHFNCGEQFLPVTDDLTSRVISFPIHTEMEDEQLEFILKSIEEFILQNRK